MKIHVVQKGETLFSIAQQYGVSARLLQKLNQAPTDGALVSGQTLVVLLPEIGSCLDECRGDAARVLQLTV